MLVRFAHTQVSTSALISTPNSRPAQALFCKASQRPWNQQLTQLRRKHMAVAAVPGKAEQTQLGTLCKAITQYAEQHVEVTGTTRLLKRAQRDLASVTALMEQNQNSALATGPGTEVFSTAMEVQLQGARNNIRGMQAELDVAEQAPGVLCLGVRFYSEVASGGGQSSPSGGRRHKLSTNHFVPSGVSVEVDVVAQQGLAWIEVKAHEPFDLDSSHWLGNPGHFKGLQQQAQQQLQVAKAACNVVRWQSPSVVFHLPQGVHPAVKAELNAMGVLVSGPGRFDVTILPAMPPAPTTVNLDVTTLCALVSEVSNGDPYGPDLQQWAQQVSHWQDCLSAEQQNPMLPMLQPFLDRQNLVTAHTAAQQFEKLLEQFGGDKEKQRWQSWKSKLKLYSLDQALATPNLTEQSCQNNLNATVSTLPNRVAALQAMSAAQKEVFALGDCLHALTLSANGKATEFAARQGVQLEVFVHRAVWLTGS